MGWLTSAFLITLFGFLTTFLNYDELFFSDQDDALERAITQPVLRPAGLAIFCFFWLIWLVEVGKTSWTLLRRLPRIRRFYHQSLGITEKDLQNMEWSCVAKRILNVPGLCPAKPNWTELDLTNRLLRKDNYLVALINRHVLDLSLPFVPESYFTSIRTIFTTPMYWMLQWCVFPHFFESNGEIRDEVLRTREDEVFRNTFLANYRRSLQKWGIVALICSPIIFLYLASYTFFEFGREVRESGKVMGSRVWSVLAQWKFREYNELPHCWQRRLRLAELPAQHYIEQFHNVYLITLARFFLFSAGALIVTLSIFALIDDNLLSRNILGPFSGLWFLSVLGIIIAVSLSLVPPKDHIFDPKKHLDEVRLHTHHTPDSWRHNEHSQKVFSQFCHLFEYRFVYYLKEVFSVLLIPFSLLVTLPRSAPRTLTFFSTFTTLVPGVGSVVVWASFDLKKCGDAAYGAAPSDQPQNLASKEGKMEKSFFNFKANNPEWTPDEAGKELLTKVLTTPMAASPVSLSRSRSFSPGGGSSPLNASTGGYSPAFAATPMRTNPLFQTILATPPPLSRLPDEDIDHHPEIRISVPPPPPNLDTQRAQYDLLCSFHSLLQQFHDEQS